MNITVKPELREWTAPTIKGPIDAVVKIPGSKSQTARALILSALADSPSTIVRPLISRDTLLMVNALEALNVGVDVSDDERWLIDPSDIGAEVEEGTWIDCGLAGTVMRFMPPLVAATIDKPILFDGDKYAYERPMGGIIQGLRDLGITVRDRGSNSLPFVVDGAFFSPTSVLEVDASKSSQLLTAFILVGAHVPGGLTVRHVGEKPYPSHPYLEMAVGMLHQAGVKVDDTVPNEWTIKQGPIAGRTWVIEPDLQNAAPFVLAPLLLGGSLRVEGWPFSTWQAGDAVRGIAEQLGASVVLDGKGLTVSADVPSPQHPLDIDIDLSDAAELTPVLAALAGVLPGRVHLHGVEHIRGHETDRVAALAQEVSNLGADVVEHRDGLTISGGNATACKWETYDDHRIAHAGAVAGLAVDGVVLSDVACTSKTWPEFAAVWGDTFGADKVS